MSKVVYELHFYPDENASLRVFVQDLEAMLPKAKKLARVSELSCHLLYTHVSTPATSKTASFVIHKTQNPFTRLKIGNIASNHATKSLNMAKNSDESSYVTG